MNPRHAKWSALTCWLTFVCSAVYGQAPLNKGQVVILVGPPGSGKTLHAQYLSKRYKVPAISTATLAQEALASQKNLPPSMKAAIASGEILQDEAAIQLLGNRIGKPDALKGFILDGFPSTEGQARFLDAFIERNHLAVPKIVVLNAPDDVVRARMLKRKRADDTPEHIERRLKEFHQEARFLETWYKPENTVRVDSTGPPDQVSRQIEEGLIVLFEKTKSLKGRPAGQTEKQEH